MDDAEVSFQTAELGKVDAGGGGTIAYIPAKYGMDVIDSGVAVPFDARSVGSYLQGRYLPRRIADIAPSSRPRARMRGIPLRNAFGIEARIQRGWAFIQLERSETSRKT